MALANLDMRVPYARWLDAVYAIVAEAPHELLDRMNDVLVRKSAQLRPDRATWGLTPEQVALSSKLTGQQPPLASGRKSR